MSRIVVPGELISTKIIRGRYLYTSKEGTRVAVIGVYDETQEKFIPLKGSYIPSVGDIVIGIVDEEKPIGYGVDILSPYKGLLPSRATRIHLAPGDVISAEIFDVSEVKDAILGRVRRLYGGRLTSISPTKVSRVIGKKNSMLNILQQGTECEIVVGRNGVIWIKGKHIQKAIDAIMKIEQEAHISGLTERIQNMLMRSSSSMEQTKTGIESETKTNS